jgi:hypothetical protein
MNPYRAELVELNSRWPGWLSGADWRWQFEDALSAEGTPPAEWLGRVDGLMDGIQIAE